MMVMMVIGGSILTILGVLFFWRAVKYGFVIFARNTVPDSVPDGTAPWWRMFVFGILMVACFIGAGALFSLPMMSV